MTMVGRNVEMSRREKLAALVAASIVFRPSQPPPIRCLPGTCGRFKGAIVEFVTEVTTPGRIGSASPCCCWRRR